jgi:hypothetical protein
MLRALWAVIPGSVPGAGSRSYDCIHIFTITPPVAYGLASRAHHPVDIPSGRKPHGLWPPKQGHALLAAIETVFAGWPVHPSFA